MHPDGNGRFCDSCAKTVIDFSIMTDKQIQNYFIQHREEKICGRFKNTQLQRIIIYIPTATVMQPLPFWKKFLAACLLIFGTSVFPFETVLADIPQQNQQHSSLTAENKKTTRKTQTAKKKKKHIKKSDNLAACKPALFDLDMETTTAGYVYTYPKSAVPALLTDSFFESDSANTQFYHSSIPFNKKSSKKKSKPTTNSSAELIIPTPLASRNRRKKK